MANAVLDTHTYTHTHTHTHTLAPTQTQTQTQTLATSGQREKIAKKMSQIKISLLAALLVAL